MSNEKIKFKDRIKQAVAFFRERPILLIVALSYSLTFINEALGRHSIWGAVVFEFTKPFMFLANMSIITVCLSLALLSKKRTYWIWVISLLWLGLGLTNFIMLFNRITPFNAMDFLLLESVFPILPVYLGWGGLIVCGVALLVAVIAIIIAWFRVKKIKVNYTRAAVTVLITAMITTTLVGGGMLTGAISEHFSSLPRAYDEHGFTLCFSISIFDRGISKPKKYSENLDDVVAFIKGDGDDGFTQPEKTPNIIFVQLESFYDLKLLDGFEFSEDPTPIFTDLKQSCTSGILTVPSIGAGTANTEFEILTGMSMEFFGSAEYPYKTFLQDRTCESLPFILKNYGYTSHAIHNYKGNFYDRHKAFSALGFDTFTSKEYLNCLGENFAGWEQDAVLLTGVMNSLKATDGPDFIQCITVQGHGKYPISAYPGERSEKIAVTSMPEGANKHAYTYFANQLYETDKFIGNLIASLEEFGEETVIVFYGDHIPNIGFEEDWVPEGTTLFDTEYVIWRSDGVREEGKDLTSYQLYSDVLNSLNIEGGMVTKLHEKRNLLTKSQYSYYLHCLQYDIVEDDGKNFYNGKLPFKATDIKLGVIDITITNVYVFGDYIYVKGTGFTQSSQIFVNGSHESTEFIDDNTLILSGIKLEDGDKVQVSQIADFFSSPLSSTDNFIYRESTNEE